MIFCKNQLFIQLKQKSKIFKKSYFTRSRSRSPWKKQKWSYYSQQPKWYCNHVKQCSYHRWYWKLQFKSFKCYIQFNIILHVIHVICMSFAGTCLSLVCHSYVIHVYSYVICMSLGPCTINCSFMVFRTHCHIFYKNPALKVIISGSP